MRSLLLLFVVYIAFVSAKETKHDARIERAANADPDQKISQKFEKLERSIVSLQEQFDDMREVSGDRDPGHGGLPGRLC